MSYKEITEKQMELVIEELKEDKKGIHDAFYLAIIIYLLKASKFLTSPYFVTFESEKFKNLEPHLNQNSRNDDKLPFSRTLELTGSEFKLFEEFGHFEDNNEFIKTQNHITIAISPIDLFKCKSEKDIIQLFPEDKEILKIIVEEFCKEDHFKNIFKTLES